MGDQNWKRRFFMLNGSKLAYYETTGVGGKGVGKKGELDIAFALIDPCRKDGQKYCASVRVASALLRAACVCPYAHAGRRGSVLLADLLPRWRP